MDYKEYCEALVAARYLATARYDSEASMFAESLISFMVDNKDEKRHDFIMRRLNSKLPVNCCKSYDDYHWLFVNFYNNSKWEAEALYNDIVDYEQYLSWAVNNHLQASLDKVPEYLRGVIFFDPPEIDGIRVLPHDWSSNAVDKLVGMSEITHWDMIIEKASWDETGGPIVQIKIPSRVFFNINAAMLDTVNGQHLINVGSICATIEGYDNGDSKQFSEHWSGVNPLEFEYMGIGGGCNKGSIFCIPGSDAINKTLLKARLGDIKAEDIDKFTKAPKPTEELAYKHFSKADFAINNLIDMWYDKISKDILNNGARIFV